MVEQLMTLKVTETPGRAIITVVGEIDISTAPQLREALATVVEEGARQVIVDLDRIRFIDSAGLNVFVRTAKQLGTDGSLRVVAAQSRTRKVFTISGLDKLIPLFDSLAAAVGDAPVGSIPDE